MNIVSWVNGLFKIKGDTDGTKIGNIGDALKVTSEETAPVNVKFTHHSLDLFDRLVVSEDYPLWSYSHRYDKDQSLYFDTYTSSGTATFVVDTDKVAQVMTNSLGNGDEMKYRTLRYFEYSKGRQQSFIFTLNPQDEISNVTKRFGCFDDKNGLFFELDGVEPAVVIRSSISGSAVDTRITQTNWNHDKLDGTGYSGLTLDWGKFALFYIHYSWLGDNAIEFGIYSDGKKLPVHRQAYAGTNETAYNQSGNLPASFEIKNTAALGTAPTMEIGCIAVFNGGMQGAVGDIFDVTTGVNEITVNTTEAVVAAIRMQSSYNEASIRPVDFSLFSTSGNSSIYYEIIIGGTFTGATWNPIPFSIAEGLASYSTFSGGQVVQSGYVKAGGEAVNINNITSNLYCGRDIAGNSQTLVLRARTIVSTSKLVFSGRYREYK